MVAMFDGAPLSFVEVGVGALGDALMFAAGTVPGRESSHEEIAASAKLDRAAVFARLEAGVGGLKVDHAWLIPGLKPSSS